MAPNILDIPRSIGDSNSIRVVVVSSVNSAKLKPGNILGRIYGLNINAIAETTTMSRIKKVTIESTNFFVSELPSPLSSVFIINGTKTETETREATVIKMKSGILKAE